MTVQKEWEESYSKLNTKQRLYVDARLTGLVPFAASKAAGYADPVASSYKLDKIPAIRSAMDCASKIARVKLDMNRDDVIEGLMDALDACANATEMTNVWKEIGKIIGAYQPMKLEITHDFSDMTSSKLMSMSNKELLNMSTQPLALVNQVDDPIDAEFKVLQDAVTAPVPIDYDK